MIDLHKLITQPVDPNTTGLLALADIQEMMDQMFANAQPEPDVIYIPLERARQLRHMYRIGDLYRAYPRPRYKLRKCHMRSLQATWTRGMRRIRKQELMERAREEAIMESHNAQTRTD